MTCMSHLRAWSIDSRHPRTTLAHRRYRRQRRYSCPPNRADWVGSLLRVRNSNPRPGGAWATYARTARQQAGLSQAEVARHVGVTRQTINRWESGKYTPENAPDVVKFALAVRVEPMEALKAAGFVPDDKTPPPSHPATQQVPLDPELAFLARKLRDRRTSAAERELIKAHLRYLSSLVGQDEQQRREAG